MSDEATPLMVLLEAQSRARDRPAPEKAPKAAPVPKPAARAATPKPTQSADVALEAAIVRYAEATRRSEELLRHLTRRQLAILEGDSESTRIRAAVEKAQGERAMARRACHEAAERDDWRKERETRQIVRSVSLPNGTTATCIWPKRGMSRGPGTRRELSDELWAELVQWFGPHAIPQAMLKPLLDRIERWLESAVAYKEPQLPVVQIRQPGEGNK